MLLIYENRQSEPIAKRLKMGDSLEICDFGWASLPRPVTVKDCLPCFHRLVAANIEDSKRRLLNSSKLISGSLSTILHTSKQ